MGHKVLLADDSITVQKIVKLSLSEEGMEVIAFGNGEQAVEQIENIKPDLVMADVFMPGKDGYEVCEFVKAHPQLKDTPVILLVHAFEPFDPERAKKAGADHQLTKPFQSIRTLVQTVQDLLAKTPSVPAPASASTAPVTETAPAIPALQPVAPIAPPVMVQPTEEFAVVSSIAPPPLSEPENLFQTQPQPTPVMAEMPMTSFSAPPPVTLVSPPVPLTEAELPGPPPISGGLVGAADMMPPLDLPVIPQISFEPVAEMPLLPEAPAPMPVMEAPTSAMPVMATPEPMTMPEMTAPVSPMAPLSSMSAPMMMTPMGMDDDDLLELPDMMPAQMSSPEPSLQPLASPPAFSNAALDMAVLPTLGATTMPPPMLAEAQPAFPQSVDMGIGKIDLNAAMSAAPVSFEEDMKVGMLAPEVSPQTNNEAMQLSEAMIEEIVKRVVERLSTKAIQEVAWEVVPEMAELMIRKQIAQHQQLSH